MVFPFFFNLSLNFAIRSSRSEPQSAPVLFLLTVACEISHPYKNWWLHTLGLLLPSEMLTLCGVCFSSYLSLCLSLNSFCDETSRTYISDFPGGMVDKNLPTNAGDTGSIPGPGRFHMLWATKSHAQNYWAHVPTVCVLQQKTPQWEACALQWRVAPAHCKLKKAYVKQWRPSTNKQTNKKTLSFIESWEAGVISVKRLWVQSGFWLGLSTNLSCMVS